MSRSTETVLCAAIHVDDGQAWPHQPINVKTGVVITGLRHHNCIVIAARLFPVGTPARTAGLDRVQGFLTTANRFVDRVEAANIAVATGQVQRENLKHPELYSEDLY